MIRRVLLGCLVATAVAGQSASAPPAHVQQEPPLLRLVHEAEFLLSRQQPELALQKYEEALREGAGSAEVLNRVAQIYLGSGNTSRAIELLQQSLSETPGQLIAYSGLNEAFLASGRLDSALHYVQQARRLAPDNSGVRSQMAYLYMQAGDLSAARTHLDSALQLDDRNAHAHRLLALLFTQTDEPDSAISRYHIVLELMPQDVEAHNNLAFLLAAQGQYLESLRWYEKTKERTGDPQLVHAINLNMGAIRAIMDGKMRARYIFVASESLAIELRGRIVDAEEDFGELATRFSKAPNAQDGGDIGFFGPGELLPVIEENVLQLQVGETSPVLPLETGYMLIQRLN